MNISENIRKHRMAKGLTQKELAIKCGLSKNVITNYENGHRTPNVDTVIEIASALKINVAQLMPEDSTHTIINNELVVALGEKKMSLADFADFTKIEISELKNIYETGLPHKIDTYFYFMAATYYLDSEDFPNIYELDIFNDDNILISDILELSLVDGVVNLLANPINDNSKFKHQFLWFLSHSNERLNNIDSAIFKNFLNAHLDTKHLPLDAQNEIKGFINYIENKYATISDS